MKLRLAILLCLTLGLWTCKKDLGTPEPSPDPVFTVGYQIDGVSYSLTAGLQTTYLFTKAELGQDNVWQLSGSFADAACPAANCPGSLRFYWRNNAKGSDFDSTLAIGNFPLFHSDSTVFTFQTTLSLNEGSGTPTEVVWKIGDSLILVGKEQKYLSNGAPFQISTEVFDLSGYRVRSSQLFVPGENMFCTRCTLDAKLDTLLTLSAAPLAPGAHTFKWNSGETKETIRVPFIPDETYSVTITNVDAGCTSMISLDHLPDTFLEIHSGFANAVAVPLTAALPGGPIIEWIDGQGTVWRSDRVGQQPFPANYFQIMEIDDYLKNENGLPTKKLRIAWNCMLYNEAGESQKMSGEGVIALGWPE